MTWHLQTVHESQADLLPLQCFYWVSDLIIKSYSFRCCWTHNAYCLWQFKMVCYPYWQLHKVYLNVFHENQRQDSQAYQELCHIDEDWLFWLFFKMPLHQFWVWVSCLEELVFSQRHHLRTYYALFTWRKQRFWAAKSHYLRTRTSYAQRLWPELTPLIKSH